MGFFGYSGFPHHNKTDRHDMTAILLKVALNAITLTYKLYSVITSIHTTLSFSPLTLKDKIIFRNIMEAPHNTFLFMSGKKP
jgi:hypothetical protein